MANGAAVKRFFAGMIRICKVGHEYTVTEAMQRRSRYMCPACASAAAIEYGRRNPEKKRVWNKVHRQRHPEVGAKHTAVYRKRYPEKLAAHSAVQVALKSGTLKRQPCQICGAEKSHAHHDDYSKPLAVEWLCHQHHMERHQVLAGGDRKP
jgi:hypothetical protein